MINLLTNMISNCEEKIEKDKPQGDSSNFGYKSK